MEGYTTTTKNTTEDPGGPRPPYALRRGIQAVKEQLRIEAVAAEYGSFRMCGGGRLLGRCVSPTHEDRTPSLTIYTDRQRFMCFGCGAHGDLLDMFMLADDWPEDSKGEALAALADRYNVALPRRSERWHEAQDDKARIREAAKKRIAAVYQRRLTRLYAPLVLVGGESPEEEIEELQELAAALWPVSLSMAGRRVAGA